MSKKDLFYGDVEGRMEELKQKPITKEKETRGEKINKSFSIMLGLVIIIGLIFTLIGLLRQTYDVSINGSSTDSFGCPYRPSHHPTTSNTDFFNRCYE